MAIYDQPSKSLFDAFKLGQKKMNIPIPSLTGGSAGPALSNTAPTAFGDISLGGGLNFFQTIALTVLGLGVLYIIAKR